jgi:hypothetical protein
LEIYNFGNVSDEFSFVKNGPYYENYGNLLDVVADLGSLVLPLVLSLFYEHEIIFLDFPIQLFME